MRPERIVTELKIANVADMGAAIQAALTERLPEGHWQVQRLDVSMTLRGTHPVLRAMLFPIAEDEIKTLDDNRFVFTRGTN